MSEASVDSGGGAAMLEPVSIPPADATPRLPEWQERIIRFVAALALAFGCYWVTWRWTSTLNLSALWFSLPLVLAETWVAVRSFFTTFTTWKLRRREPRPAPPGLSVDVFITTYDEPLEIIRRTAVAARQIRYPHRTYLLDDGKREEVRALAGELGVDYIRRAGNEHAKAGNLNHALSVTQGEFILQLDADHVPLPHILDRLLGFFDDARTAFVQSPQDFYNVDSFTHDVNEKARRIWEEQRLFFSIIQPGKDHWNAAFFCGSCGVIRRAALDHIGGFSTLTLTEDMETSLVLHGRGWRSVFWGESLAYGLAPASAAAYHVQRLRWGQGAMQILRKLNPLRYPGLTLAQRICYLDSVSSYLDGFAKLVLYLSPIVFFFSGVLPIHTTDHEFLVRFIPFLALQLTAHTLLFRGSAFLRLAERYNMSKFFTYVVAISGYFAKGRLRFHVTPKGPGDVPFKTYAPQLVLVVLTVLAVSWGTLASTLGWMNYQVPGWGSLAFWFNFGWALYHFAFAGYVLQLSLYVKQQRADQRFRDEFPVEVSLLDPGGREAGRCVALTSNLHPGGVALRAMAPVEPGTRVLVRLPLLPRTVAAHGVIVHRQARQTRHGPVYAHGVRFEGLSLDDRDAIELHCTQHAAPARRLRYRDASDLFNGAVRWIYDARSDRRRVVRLPVRISLEAPDGPAALGLGLLEDVSRRGARLQLGHPLPPGARIGYEIPGSEIAGAGVVVFTRALETPLGVQFTVGVKLDVVAATGRSWRRLGAARLVRRVQSLTRA
ncbi:MAG: glycosyltransferase [Gemmatimonadetes bacterium]|nr:glycosyltransferase [Gemmatimonadota bacterium]